MPKITFTVTLSISDHVDRCLYGHPLEDDRLGCVICFANRRREHLALAKQSLERLMLTQEAA